MTKAHSFGLTIIAGAVALAGTGIFNIIQPASAQSFSCANAQIPSEMAVCNNEALLIKDEQLAALFASAIIQASTNGNSQAVSKEHGKWLRDRNACAVDFECLEKKYDERIKSLTGRDL
ncbi:MAG: lysozyme inhibitor LprI family protein [Rhizobiaceae bacterium]